MNILYFVYCLLHLFSYQNSVPPNTFLIDGNTLKLSLLEISQGNALYVQARSNLVEDAERILDKGPYSVTFKEVSIPGVGKNDYLSLSRYWWPNENTIDGLPYIRKDGMTNPDREAIPDFKMMNDMGNNVLTLGLAYYFTNDERYAKHAKYLVEVFFFNRKTRMNPHFEFSQIILGHPNSGGATISATALIPFIDGIQLIKSSNHWRKRDHKRLQAWFSSFLDWMLCSKKGQSQAAGNNNVGTYYTVQTILYALFIDDINLAREIFERQAYQRVDTQISKAGEMKNELSRASPWSYITFNLRAFDRLVAISRKLGIELWDYESPDGGSIEKAFEWLVPYAKGVRRWEYSEENVTDITASRILDECKSCPFSLDLPKDPNNYHSILY